ncbi:MAG TPA: hypothetical protein VGO00_14335 [Kofleriaceae bacterium]|nr:hypothetical protein [Kofleriaceae bacterium]
MLCVVLAGCVDVPSDYACTTDSDCTALVPGRCEATGACSFPDASCGIDGYRYDSLAGSRSSVCVLADRVTQAELEFAGASDRVDGNCSSAGAPDVMFELTVTAAQTIVFDSPGVAASIAVYAGACPPSTPSDGVCAGSPCDDPTYGRAVQTLGAGSYCVVAEQAAAASSGMLRVFPINGPAILPTGSTATDKTCGHPANAATPSCFTRVGPSIPMLVWSCPAVPIQLDASVAPQADLDIGLTLRNAMGDAEVTGGCADAGGNGAAETIHASLDAPGPYWLMIDGAGGGGAMQCGTFTVDYSL